MPATLTVDQLRAAFTAAQIEAIDDQWPTISGTPDPVAEEILAALSRVDAYSAGWSPAAALLTGWTRDLAAWHILKRLALASEDHRRAYERALTELEELRDGKFQNTPRAATPTTGRVSYGSREKIL